MKVMGTIDAMTLDDVIAIDFEPMRVVVVIARYMLVTNPNDWLSSGTTQLTDCVPKSRAVTAVTPRELRHRAYLSAVTGNNPSVRVVKRRAVTA